ncbi:3-phosphoshikimate 1-carboxyvinyltransferase [Dethiosulfatarculus sandiegensis]|uniref:3-phosphoshikimate 1-carboxyvinyltransferase n=1 Tax=Dethiosulfatarculus sandiegensis TaxID=1429043 RepID=A0A0D2JAN8_9BACT|nr:3-phosphoshikimate 1-carboxyvinyltransferase [Dethiosulfatarculus sandiegensis]KIX12796.1 3-phosphoshikimate 1-carboxyvinyltransferase [Dethiosulfatarculus sandiegensis]
MKLKGSFKAPGDKSISHRIALFSLLGKGRMQVNNFSPCADCASSLKAVNLLGGEAHIFGDMLSVEGALGEIKDSRVDCGNSGTTMRLLMGLLAGRPGEFCLDGDESLRKRPMQRVADPLRQMGAELICEKGNAPVFIKGKELKACDHTLSVASAQLKSALLLAGLQARGVTTVREPAQSRDHTERLLTQCKAACNGKNGTWQVAQSELDLPERYWVPGDISSAAFLITAALINPDSRVMAEDVLLNPTRIGFLKVLLRMGADLKIEQQGNHPEPWGRVTAGYTPKLEACEIMAEEIPLMVDEVPILALAASQARGVTIFRQVGELRIKESDRISAICSQLSALGVDIRVKDDDLLVTGPAKLKPVAELDSFGDHRIAMTLAIACALAENQANIKKMESAAISYPGFQDALNGLMA